MLFADREIDVAAAMRTLCAKFGTNKRGVFERAYSGHNGDVQQHGPEALRRIAEDYAEACNKEWQWLPYYVLRAACPDVTAQ